MKRAIETDPRQLSLFDDPPRSGTAELASVATPVVRKRTGPPPIVSGRGPPTTLTAESNLADVLAVLEADAAPDRRRKDTKSAVRRMGRVLHRPLVDIPADPAQLRLLLVKGAPASAGMSKACWSRVRSLVHAALRDAGIDAMPGRDVLARTPAWTRLVADLPNQSLRLQLSAFVSHCSRSGVEPEAVSLGVFAAFRAALNTRNRKRAPEAAYRATVASWNKAVACTPTWPRLTVELKAHPRFYSLEWSAFPASFVADVEAFLAKAADRDEFSADYAKAVRLGTVELRRRQLRQLATVCTAKCVPAAALIDLSVLIKHATELLKAERDRQGKLSVSLGHKAWLLCIIARHWVKDLKAAEDLRAVAGRLSVKQKGMTQTNRDLLRQFDLPENVTALLDLPDRVFRRAAAAKAGTADEARSVMLALAVELLTVAPMRIDNLTNLDVERHLLHVGRGRASNRHIHIKGEETKTGATFEVVLPKRTAALLEVYLARYRRQLCPAPSPYLFPSPSGGVRATTRFATAICQFVERETSLKVHVHLFRHLAGKLYLAAHPEGLETVRQILQHTSSATTSRYYVEHKISDAFRRYDATLSGHRPPGVSPSASNSKSARSVVR